MKLFVYLLMISGTSLAQASSFVLEKTISLTVGVVQDEKVPFIPKNYKFIKEKGLSRLTSIAYDPKTKTMRFNPKRPGFKTLTIRDAKLNIIGRIGIDVTKNQLSKVVRELKSLLGDIEGIQIRIINNKVLIDGQVLLPKDLSRIYVVVKQYGGVVSSLVTISPLAQKKIAAYIERDINNPEISVRAVNGKFILEGVAKSQAEKDRSLSIAFLYAPDVVLEDKNSGIKKRKIGNANIIDLIKIKKGSTPPPGKMLQIVLHYVELKKNYTKGFRFQWTPSLGDESKLQFESSGRSPSGVISSITGTISNLLPKLNWAKQHGHAKILKSSTIIVQDKKQGSFNSVTQIPYPTTSEGGQVVTKRIDVGLKTVVTPQILGPRSDSISLDVNFNIGSVTGSSDDGPLTSKNDVKTTIVLRSGQSAAIAGLISNTSGIDYNKLPDGVTNPIVSLYASKAFVRNQSQFVVFVTPIIKSSASAGSEKIKRKFRLRN